MATKGRLELRIAVIGDFHLHPEQLEMTSMAMRDIADCGPDLVVPLGDFGSKEYIGCVEGLRESKAFLDTIGAPIKPILGNHDLQRESGEGKQAKGVMEHELRKLFHLSASYGTIEYENFRLFFASTEPQSADSCYTVQECFVTDEQFESLVVQLNERRGIPVLFFTHAPPIGCGLRTVPRVHVRATNAYLDQNHNPYRWRQLYRDYPEIVGWFSSHYHLGHHDIDSQSVRWGTHFFHTGVHGTCTRDGQRLSRIIDITSQGFHVHTLDHRSQALTNIGEYRYNGSLSNLMISGGSIEKNAEPTKRGLRRRREISVGEASTLADQLVPIGNMRFVCSTADGFSWEAAPEVEAVMGTLHIGSVLHSVCFSNGFVWFSWGNFIGKASVNDPYRFVRTPKASWPREKMELPGEPACLTSSDKGIWFSITTSIFQMGWSGEYQLKFKLEHNPVKICESEAGLRILDIQGNLWHCDMRLTHEKLIKEASNVVAFDASGDGTVIAQMDVSLKLVWTKGDGGVRMLYLNNRIAGAEELHILQIVCLRNDAVLLNLNGTVYVWDTKEEDLAPVPAEHGPATAVSRAYTPDESSGGGFAVSRDSGNAFGRTRLEVWEY